MFKYLSLITNIENIYFLAGKKKLLIDVNKYIFFLIILFLNLPSIGRQKNTIFYPSCYKTIHSTFHAHPTLASQAQEKMNHAESVFQVLGSHKKLKTRPHSPCGLWSQSMFH